MNKCVNSPVIVTSSFRVDVTVKFGRMICKLEITFKSLSDITGNHAFVPLLVSVLETQVSQLYLSAHSLPAQITFHLLFLTTKPKEQNMLNTRVSQKVSPQCIYFGLTTTNSNYTVHTNSLKAIINMNCAYRFGTRCTVNTLS